MTTRITDYQSAKERYESVVPIRGRAGDVRPIGERRRDHELICKVNVRHEETGEMVEAYACRLYDTDVVTYFPDDTITLYTGGWATKSTLRFMNNHGRHRVLSSHGVMWFIDRKGNYHPFDRMIRVKHGDVINPQPYKVRVVDREASASVRRAIKPFTDFCTTMLKLSDGWMRYETFREIGVDETVRFAMHTPRDAERALFAMENKDEDHHMRMLLAVLGGVLELKPVEKRHAGKTTEGYDVYDLRFTVEDFKARINAIIYKTGDVWTTKECEPTTCPRDNVVI